MSRENSQRMEEALARLSQGHTQSQIEKKSVRAQENVTISEVVETNDITTNPFFHIMKGDPTKSNSQKITEAVDYLTAKNDDFLEARKRFMEFDAYFTHEQGEGMELDLKGIQELIDEVRNALKPQIQEIVMAVSHVQNGVQQSRKLLEVLREARVQGKTIDEIRSALEINERLGKEIVALQSRLVQWKASEQTSQQRFTDAQERKNASEQGFMNAVVRLFRGSDKEILAAIEIANEQLIRAQQEIERTQQGLQDKQNQREESLETGPLVILRSIDVTEKSFSHNIIATAEQSIQLIRGAQESIGRLIQRTNYSEGEARAINNKLAETEVRETILKGVLHQVTETIRKQGKTVKEKLDVFDQDIAGLVETSPIYALKSADRAEMAQRYREALEYEETLNLTIARFDIIASNSMEARSQANQLEALIKSEKELLHGLSTEALPATARGLRLVLQHNVAQQTNELALSVREVTKRARDVGKDSLSQLLQTQQEIHKQEIDRMDAAITALNTAEDALVSEVTASVDRALEKGDKRLRLEEATAGLQDVMEQLEQIRPTVAARMKTDETVPSE